jgi:hypothetical protein
MDRLLRQVELCGRRDTCGDVPGYLEQWRWAHEGAGFATSWVERNPPDAVQRAMNHIALDATSGRLQEGLQNGRAFFTYVNVSFSFSYFSS